MKGCNKLVCHIEDRHQSRSIHGFCDLNGRCMQTQSLPQRNWDPAGVPLQTHNSGQQFRRNLRVVRSIHDHPTYQGDRHQLAAVASLQNLCDQPSAGTENLDQPVTDLSAGLVVKLADAFSALAALLWALRPTEGGFLISIWIERLRVAVQPRRLDDFRPFANLGAPAARAVPLVWKTRRGEVGLSLSVQSANQQEK